MSVCVCDYRQLEECVSVCVSVLLHILIQKSERCHTQCVTMTLALHERHKEKRGRGKEMASRRINLSFFSDELLNG